MTQKALKKFESLRAATARYSPHVQKKLSGSRKKGDMAIMESAAKYYVALKQLATE